MIRSCIKRFSTTTPAHSVLPALRDNPACRIGILAEQRLAYLEKGINSHQQDKELLALISDMGDWWYGYVLRVGPEFPGDRNQGEWLAILVQSGVPVDGYSQKEVFRCAQKSWFRLLEYHAYYIQEPQDGGALCHSFEEAVTMLRHIIVRFDIRKRIAWERDADGNLLAPEGSKLDRRCMDLFGLSYDNFLIREA